MKVTANATASASASNSATAQQPAPASAKMFINKFAKLCTPKGAVFGYIDNVTDVGFSFIYSADNCFGAKILHPADLAFVSICETPADLASAKAATLKYIENETADLRFYLTQISAERNAEKERVEKLIKSLAQIRRCAGV